MKSSTFLSWWAIVFVLAVSSALLAFWRLDGVPQLPIDLGPDLSVRRSQAVEGAEPGLQLSRGDRLKAFEGHSVSSLSEIRAIILTLTKAAGPQIERRLSADFQAVRPLHRFTLTLRGEAFDGKMLPLGVEPTDDLIEVDGRALPGRVGPEGLKSIMASRPEAVLGFERRNAVFGGKLIVARAPLNMIYLFVFGFASFAVLVLMRLRSRRLDPRFAASVALETVLFAWVLVLVLRYQWFIADSVLAACAVSAFVVVRPVAFVGRAFERDEESLLGPFLSLLLALAAALAVNVLMVRGVLTSERALQFAAVTGSLYIVYELVAGFARVTSNKLERSIYLVGVIVVCALAALFEYLTEPTQFLEDQWVIYASIALGLVWFSDIILCLRGPAVSGLDEIAILEDRQQKVLSYLDALSEELSDTAFRILLVKDGHSVSMGRGLMGFEVNEVDTALHDAMEIMIDEGARIPALESTAAHADPMAGIARTMNIKVATLIPPPAGGAQISDMFLIVLGVDIHKGGEGPDATVEVLQEAHRLMNGTTWTAAILEGAPNLGSGTRDEIGPAEPAIDPEQFDALESRISELESEAEDLTDGRADLERAVEVLAGQSCGIAWPELSRSVELVEPELLDGLDYLMETPEPVVICGPRGAGKRFTAYLSHQRDSEHVGYLLNLDAARITDERGFPDIGAIDEDVFVTASNGAIVVQSSGLLSVQQIKALLHRARDSFRLYLLFDIEEPDQRSALDQYPELEGTLAHRELIIPQFNTRHTIKRAVIQYYLEEAATRLRKEVFGISGAAWEHLLAYRFVGEIRECKVVIQRGVARAKTEVLDVDDL